MKHINTLLFFLLIFSHIQGQNVPPQDIKKVAPNDTIVPWKGPPEDQLKEIKKVKIEKLSDSTGNEPKKTILVDTTKQNKYGDLLNDDTAYNKKYPLWIPLTMVVGTNIIVWSLDRYLINAPYSHIGLETWQYNIRKGWEWDDDRFGINFIGHPYSGSMLFNTGRANGYNYLESGAFAVTGSLMWEYFGENTRPSYNDIITTPVNGAFLGEMFYRLSSNVLDDRTRGAERVFREILAGIIDPKRGLNRLLQGKTFRTTNKEIYQKEPLNVTLYGGLHKINYEPGSVLGSGSGNIMFNLKFDYGNPFELRLRKPFDFFKFRMEMDFGVGRKILSDVNGYGILFGQNYNYPKHSILVGGFQYYDYWDNKSFELGAIAFGGGVFSKLPVSKTSILYTNASITNTYPHYFSCWHNRNENTTSIGSVSNSIFYNGF